MTQLHRLLYCSRSAIEGAPEEVAGEIRGILARSRVNNARDGLTGGLLFGNGCFAQVLEGSLPEVEGAFERIQCDERHQDVTVLRSGPIESRDFPSWSMAFAGAVAGPSPLADVALDAAFAGQSAAGDRILDLMRDVVVREDEWASGAAQFAMP